MPDLGSDLVYTECRSNFDDFHARVIDVKFQRSPRYLNGAT